MKDNPAAQTRLGGFSVTVSTCRFRMRTFNLREMHRVMNCPRSWTVGLPSRVAVICAAVFALWSIASAAVPLVRDADESRNLLSAAAMADAVRVARLAGSDSGTLFEGRSRALLPPGRYRLHVPLSLAPVAGPVAQGLQIQVSVAGRLWTVAAFDFTHPDAMQDFTFDFTVAEPATPTIKVTWNFDTPLGRDGRRRDTLHVPPDNPESRLPPLTDTLGHSVPMPSATDMLLDELAGDGLISIDDALPIAYRLMTTGIHLRRLPPLHLVSVRADRLVYAPEDSGELQVHIHNTGTTTAAGRLDVTLVRELADRAPLTSIPLELYAGERRIFQIPFTATGRWGVGVDTTLDSEGEARTVRDYFSVTENFFEIGIAHGAGPVQTGVRPYQSLPETMRRSYSNMLELFFWSPCDWAVHVSPLPEWWSGQTSYHHHEANLHALIQAVQAQGMRALMYASCHPAGPFGWDAARRRPEWFTASPWGALGRHQPNVEALEKWNDPEWRRTPIPEATPPAAAVQRAPTAPSIRTHPGWFQIPVDLRRSDALDYGISRIIDGVRHYGWDAVRFDGHYTVVGQDAVSTRNMRRLKERTLDELPGFRLGFNYGYSPAGQGGVTHEMREAMAGGGLYMQEGIRNWRYGRGAMQYQGWRHYATNELHVAKQVKALGGHYHCIWDLEGLPQDQAYYKFAYGVIAGAHPYYAKLDGIPGCPNWGAFLTRWSSMLWDPALRVVDTPDDSLRIESEAPIQWRPFIQQRVVSPERAFRVVHLVRPPEHDAIQKTAFPDRRGGFSLAWTPDAGTRATRAVLIRPETPPFATALAIRRAEAGTLHVEAPALGYWAMLVLELDGAFELPAGPAAFTEPPDSEAVAAAERAARQPRPQPGGAELLANAGPGVILHPFNHGSANIPTPLTFDPDARLGTVQWRAPEVAATGLGSYWMTHVPAGEHRLLLRIKWTDEKDEPTPQMVRVTLSDNQPRSARLLEATLVTPDHPEAPPGAGIMDARAAYRFYTVGQFEMPQPDLVHLVCQVSTAAVGDNALYLESARIEAVAGNTDRALAEAADLPPKPEGLRTPNGQAPNRILWLNGLFAELYARPVDARIDGAYDLPSDHRALYAYDALVLANVDLSRTTLARRRMLHDYILDGGRLVVLGGSQTLGQGGFYGTFAADVLPVDLGGPYEVVKLDEPAVLGPLPGRRFAGRPYVFWRHKVSARAGADVLAWADAQPLVFTWPQGRGRVSVFAGTVLGEGSEGLTPFWKTESWNELLATLLFK